MVLSKKIWTYWVGPKNDIYYKCRLSWMYYLKGWKINIINKDNLHKWGLKLPSTFDILTPTAQSDIIRINLLYKYGGIWIDATVLLLRNFDWLENICKKYRKYDYFACQAWDAEFIENWLLVVNISHNPYIKKWRDALLNTLEYWPSVNKAPYYHGKKYTRNDSYFMMYQCYCYLVNNDKKFKKAVVLPNSVQLAFVPVIFPLDLLDPRCFIKFTSNCRRRAAICQNIFNLLCGIICTYLVVKILYILYT